MSIREQLIGTWRLTNWIQRRADGTLGSVAVDSGYLIYTDADRMCAVFMDSKRAKWGTAPPKTVDEAIQRNAGNLSYCAAVEINEAERSVKHHVDIAKEPDAVGVVRKRWFTFLDANTLEIRVDRAELQPGVSESVLSFRRVIKP